MIERIKKVGLSNCLLYVLIVIHVGWLIVHVSLTSQGIINQWKLAGYGMYTGPSPKATLEIFTLEDTLTTKKLTTRKRVANAYWYPYKKVNYDFNIYCVETNAEKINLLLANNPELVGENLLLQVVGRFMEKDPVRPTLQTISETEILWTGADSYRFAATVPFCNDKKYSGVGSFVTPHNL